MLAATTTKTLRRMATLTRASQMPCRHDDYNYDGTKNISTLEKTIKTNEKDLCTVRALLFLVASGKPLTPSQTALLQTEMDKHKEHRMSDVAAEVKWIDNKLSEVSKVAEQMKEICVYLQEMKTKYEEQIKKGDAHIMDRDDLDIPDFELIKVKVDGLQGNIVIGKFLR